MEYALENMDSACIKKEVVLLKTYPFSDPSPVPEFGRLYPYNRFDGYTDRGTEHGWEMVVMENNYVKIWINPLTGGKIWGAIEKSSGKEFIYFNHTAKFRDVAMRGPWTSGGMETNMGIIGHSPSCSSPVDYEMAENTDGSVSCFIGATDWPSRTEWRVEIRLAADTAYFTTKSWWNNNSCLPQSYYQWNNVGIKTSGNLEYVYPGHYRLGHDGTPLPWPDDEGREIAFYDKNDYGEYKSYHVFGAYSDFWGCYWHKDNFGMGHSSAYDAKPGKKIWIWGLSRYGMIWEDLLTDSDGQYTEVQSGRLFNQSIAASSKTPFKHRSFLPYTADQWEEHWFPVKDTGGLTYGNHQLSFCILEKNGNTFINICANEPLDHILKLTQNYEDVLVVPLSLNTMQNCSFLVSSDTISMKMLQVRLNETIIYNGPEQHYELKRPVKSNEAYDFGSVQALYIQAKEWERQRFYERAVRHYKLCLQKDPFYVEALTGLSGLYFKQLKYSEALRLLTTALAVDTYHDEANYLYGLVNDKLNQAVDAKDGFSIASQSPTYRVAAYIELAKLFLRENQIDKASSYVKKAAVYQSGNLQVVYLEIIIGRMQGNVERSGHLSRELLKTDPLNYLARFELGRGTQNNKLTSSELPYETYIELAAFYNSLNCYADALEILSAAPDYAMVHLWKAHLYAVSGSVEQIQRCLDAAIACSAEFVFPHRQEDLEILSWATNCHSHWKFKYYLALALIQNLRKEEALVLLNSCVNEPDFYPFYSVRASLKSENDTIGQLIDLKLACHYGQLEWRAILNLSNYFAGQEDWAQALITVEQGYQARPDNYYLGLHLAKCYMQIKNFEAGITLLKNITVLPNEGASDGRNSWREIHLHAAMAAMAEKDWQQARLYIDAARTWPENIGVGKPYHVDERLEDYMELICTPPANKAERQVLTDRIAFYRDRFKVMPYGSADLISMLLLREAGELDKADRLLADWQLQDPDALALKWSLAVINGNQQKIDRLSSQKPVVKEVLPYEIPFEDRPFLFVKKLYQNGFFDAYDEINNNIANS
jgi:tetratricopeptide (TPR) repeat protein